MRPASAYLLSLCLLGCVNRPARFAELPPVVRISDDSPIPLPQPTRVIGPVYHAEAYVRRPVVNALDATRIRAALDVNSLDEVPTSSWYSPVPLDATGFARSYVADGEAKPPLKVVRQSKGDVHVRDARGLSYVITADPPSRPHTASAAEAIASRLVRGLGYRTSPTWILRKATGLLSGDIPAPLTKSPVWRITRWPPGIVLGPTSPTSTRGDDPNDRIPRQSRRTLRVLGLVGAWLEIPDFGPSRLVDVYVGPPGKGHVRHYVTGLSASLGAGALGKHDPVVSAAGTIKGSVGWNLITFGFYRPDEHAEHLSLTVFRPGLEQDHPLDLPFAPTDHLLPGDGYWLAKRLSRIKDAFISRAIDDARIPNDALRRHLRSAIAARRDQLVARLMRRVTPCEVSDITPDLLSLSDSALETGSARRIGSAYHVTFLDDLGQPLMRTVRVSDPLGEIDVPMPEAIRHRDYTIVRVLAERDGKRVPSAMEIHLASRGRTPYVVGIRH